MGGTEGYVNHPAEMTAAAGRPATPETLHGAQMVTALMGKVIKATMKPFRIWGLICGRTRLYFHC